MMREKSAIIYLYNVLKNIITSYCQNLQSCDVISLVICGRSTSDHPAGHHGRPKMIGGIYKGKNKEIMSEYIYMYI